jgi:dihydropyrimidine dehydrogenase (NAD+) subunit PreA
MTQQKSGPRTYGGYTLQWAMEEAQRCLLCEDAPCSKGCPGSTDPARFIRQIRFQNYKGAARTVMGNNPLGGVCTYVCPTDETCTGACLREELDRPIDIDALQRFAVEYGRAHGVEPPAVADPREQKVAVVGAGPAGLTAAARLARRGYQVTVLEKRGEAGGMLRYGVPESRLPKHALRNDLDELIALGVTVELDHEVTGDDPAAELMAQGYDAVFVAPGLWRPIKLDLPGGDLAGNSTAVEFLDNNRAAPDMCADLVAGKNVAIIGGGSVAMDVARVARQHGAARLYAVALESINELPAQRDELAEANADGLQILGQHRVTRVLGDGGQVTGIEGVETEWVEPGKLVPSNARDVEGTAFTLKVGAVIQAIGQAPERGGMIKADPETLNIAKPGAFAGGDIIRGAGTVIGAVGDGKRAAEAIHRHLGGDDKPIQPNAMVDLSIDFCGVRFPNPFCLSSSPVGNDYDMCARAMDMGWGGVVYKTVGLDYEVKITHPSPRLNALHRGPQRVVGLQNVEQISDRPTKDNFDDLTRLKKDYPNNAIVASIMGLTHANDWVELAKRAEGAGADMIECNFSCPQMTVEGTGHKVGQDADIIERLTAMTKGACNIPVMAKMTPNVADMLPMALAAQRGGADAVSAINTVKAISQVDLEQGVPMPNVDGRSSSSGYSGTACKPIALRFISDMAKDERLTIPISGMGGIYTWRDAAEHLLLGATTLQVTTAIMQHGYRIVDDMREGLSDYLRDRGYKSVSEMVGKALECVVDPSELSHANQAVSLIDSALCIGCGQCYHTCRDAAAHCITLDADRKAIVDEEECFGCLMCKHICPVDGCISYKIVPHHMA